MEYNFKRNLYIVCIASILLFFFLTKDSDLGYSGKLFIATIILGLFMWLSERSQKKNVIKNIKDRALELAYSGIYSNWKDVKNELLSEEFSEALINEQIESTDLLNRINEICERKFN